MSPEKIDFSRKKRISKGSGTSIEQVNELINQFLMMKKVMRNPGIMGHATSGMAGMPSMPIGSGFGFQRGPNRMKKKEKRRKKR
jgi:signal recognition particle subunit SRP54